jgi:hypothetical protein
VWFEGYKFQSTYAVQGKLYTGDILRKSAGETRGMEAGERTTAGAYHFAGDPTNELSLDALYAEARSFASETGDIGICVIRWVRLKGKWLHRSLSRTTSSSPFLLQGLQAPTMANSSAALMKDRIRTP